MQTQWMWIPLAAISTSAYAAVYLSVEQAQQAIFPGAQFTAQSVVLDDEQLAAIARRSSVPAPRHLPQVWKTADGSVLFVDQVIGKHDLITYAVGVNPDGSVKQVEIMEYRESYGYEVRNAQWRRQFVGKTVAAPLKLDEDIRNISGATLSCSHVTEGVKRLLAFYDVALRK